MNDKRFPEPSQNFLFKTGRFNSWAIPLTLWHGTSLDNAQKILANGLDYLKSETRSFGSTGGNYLSTNLNMAASYARTRSGEKPACIIAVDSICIDPDLLDLDFNISISRHCGESVSYSGFIAPQFLQAFPTDPHEIPQMPLLLSIPEPFSRPLVINTEWEMADDFLQTSSWRRKSVTPNRTR